MEAIVSAVPVWGLVLLGGLLVVQITLDVIALLDLYRRPVEQVVFANKWVWVAVVLLVSMLGAIIYLLAARKPDRLEREYGGFPLSIGGNRQGRRHPLQQRRQRWPRSAMSAAIRTTALAKSYGENQALVDVDLVVEEGSVFGFLGPNGVGKTTTLHLLTGLTRHGERDHGSHDHVPAAPPPRAGAR